MIEERRTDMKLAAALSERIKTLREVRGMSQQEVAVKADLSLSLVAKLEQGKKADPRASTLLALMAALDVKAGDLLDNLNLDPEPEEESAKPKKKKTKKAAKKLKKKSRATQ
jgi:transcriptional regulator with XRE-family HTH domain